MNERPDAVCATCGTDEKALYSQVAQVIQQYKDKEGSLIMVLHAAQEIFGYLPMQLQEFIADGMDLPVSEVSGVVSFYSFFSTQKRGKHTSLLCPWWQKSRGCHQTGSGSRSGWYHGGRPVYL